jgi:hypothetical protein
MNRSELRTAIRRGADMVNSLFVTDDELDNWIDLSVASLYDILVAQYGDEYWSSTTWIQVRPGTDTTIAWPRLEIGVDTALAGPDTGYPSSYILPDDFVRLVRCQYLAGTVTRQQVEVGELTAHAPETVYNWTLNCPDKHAYPMHRIDTPGQEIDFTPRSWLQTHVGYRLRRGVGQQLRYVGFDAAPIYSVVTRTGTVIDFLPVPDAYYAVQVTYVPRPMLLPNHPFPEYLINDCIALCLEKQQSDSSVQRALQARVVEQIQQYSRTPDAANPPKIVDVYGSNRIPGSNSRLPW